MEFDLNLKILAGYSNMATVIWRKRQNVNKLALTFSIKVIGQRSFLNLTEALYLIASALKDQTSSTDFKIIFTF